jgi:hypothetical protein
VIAMLALPLAHAGHIIEALPFFAPALVLPLGIAAVSLHERRQSSRPHVKD